MLKVRNLGRKISEVDLFEVRTLNKYGLGTCANRYSLDILVFFFLTKPTGLCFTNAAAD